MKKGATGALFVLVAHGITDIDDRDAVNLVDGRFDRGLREILRRDTSCDLQIPLDQLGSAWVAAKNIKSLGSAFTSFSTVNIGPCGIGISRWPCRTVQSLT